MWEPWCGKQEEGFLPICHLQILTPPHPCAWLVREGHWTGCRNRPPSEACSVAPPVFFLLLTGLPETLVYIAVHSTVRGAFYSARGKLGCVDSDINCFKNAHDAKRTKVCLLCVRVCVLARILNANKDDMGGRP